MPEAQDRQSLESLFVGIAIFANKRSIVLQAVFIDAVYSHVVAFDEAVELVTPTRLGEFTAPKSEHTETQLLVAAVHEHGMPHRTGRGGLWFGEQHGIHLVVEQHVETHIKVVYLNAVNIIFGFYTIYCHRGQSLSGRVASDGYHLVAQLFQFFDTSETVGDELPIGICGYRIAQGDALALCVAGRFY